MAYKCIDQGVFLSAAAFAVTGIIAGVFLLVLIAIVNVYTSDMLIRQCRITGTVDYDTLTYAVGGPIWRVS
jgi:Transmembrane amino acid transporter protein